MINTTAIDGLIIKTSWDENHTGPVELQITIDPTAYPDGKGITERVVRRLSLQSMTPDSMKVFGNLRAVGDWLETNRPTRRGNSPDDPDLFYSHVSLFFVLAVQDGEKGVTQILASYAGIRPSMARMWIASARKRGYLTDHPTGRMRGRAYGCLTEKARSILGGQSDIWRSAA